MKQRIRMFPTVLERQALGGGEIRREVRLLPYGKDNPSWDGQHYISPSNMGSKVLVSQLGAYSAPNQGWIYDEVGSWPYKAVSHWKWIVRTEVDGGAPLISGNTFPSEWSLPDYYVWRSPSSVIASHQAYILANAGTTSLIKTFTRATMLRPLQQGVQQYLSASDRRVDLRQSFNQDFSLVNFILELDDIGRTLRYIRSVGYRLGRLAVLARREHGATASVAEVLNLLGQGHLTWAFGLSPLIRDLETIWSVLTKYSELNRKLLLRASRPNWKRYMNESARLGPDGNWYPKGNIPSSVAVPCHSPFGGRVTCRQYFRIPPTLMGGVAYRLLLPGISGFLARIAQMSDSLGVSLDPSIVWNAIPFSFVLDWTRGIQNYLHSSRWDWFQMRTYYLDALASLKYQVIREWSLERHCLSRWAPPNSYYLFEPGSETTRKLYEVYTSYSRFRAVPDLRTKVEIEDDVFEFREMMLSASLAASIGLDRRYVRRALGSMRTRQNRGAYGRWRPLSIAAERSDPQGRSDGFSATALKRRAKLKPSLREPLNREHGDVPYSVNEFTRQQIEGD